MKFSELSVFRQVSLTSRRQRFGTGYRLRPLLEPLEARYLLDGDPVALADDVFDAHQNSSTADLDVLANDHFDPAYPGERRITSVSYGSEGGRVEISESGQSILYRTPADFFGTETFLYVVDQQFAAQVKVSVASPLEFDTYEIPPDGIERQLKVLENDPFWTGYTGLREITSFSVSSAGGNVALATDRRSVFYTPPEDVFGNDEFIYIVDGLYSARVTVTVPKTLEPDRFEIVQNTQANVFAVIANDPFWKGYTGARRITHIVDSSLDAGVEITADGRAVLYTPAPDFSGWDSFRYVVDGNYESPVSVRIHRPVQEDSFQSDENSSNQLFVLTDNDVYRDLNRNVHDVIDRVTSLTEPESGATVEISPDGQGVIYTPPVGYAGTDTFTYLADGLHEARVTVQVTRPVRNDYFSDVVYQDTPNALLDVMANDFLGNGYTGARRITSVGPSENGGDVRIGLNQQSLRYTPALGVTGHDRFTYTIDSQLEAEVTLQVIPLAQTDYYSFCTDPTHGVYRLNVLDDDHFHRGYSGPGRITSVSELSGGGTVTIDDGQNLLFTPGTSAWNTFQYTVDGQYEASVTVSIVGHLSSDLFVVDQNSTSTELDVLENDFSFQYRTTCNSNHYLGSRRITAASGSVNGGLVEVSTDNRSLNYRPPTDFHGQDTFTYTVDGIMETSVQVQVIRRVRDDHFRVDAESSSETLPVLVNDLFGADYFGVQQITSVTESSAGATVSLGNNGRSILYTAAAGFVGTDTFTYTVDGALKAQVNVVVDSGHESQFPQFETLEDYQQFLIDDALNRYSHLFGQPAWFGCWICLDGHRSPGPFEEVALPAREHSETNVQVAGVDEGDIVEFDSDYVYVLTDEDLVIVDAWPAETLSIASRVEIEGTPIAEFLQGDRLTVISDTGGDFPPWEPWIDDISPLAFDASSRIWPSSSPTPSSTIVTVVDVSDRTEPAIVQTTTMEGSYVESRAVGDYVYVLLRNDNAVAPPPEVISEAGPNPDPNETGSPTDDIRPWPEQGTYETRDEYLARITANLGELVDEALPNYTSYLPDGAMIRSGLLNEPEGIYRPLLPDASHLVSLVSFRVMTDDPGLASTAGVYASGASTVYASRDNFYVFDEDYTSADGATTRIMKFDWESTAGGVDFVATTAVVGSILNQFSADERDGYLRIATTFSNASSGNWSGRAENALFVLQEDEGSFEFVGSLQNLALGETIRSIRYLADRTLVTTFRTVDPLFSLDLSDPEHPRVLGQLTLPGFSTYMQLIDDDHLLTVGRNTPNGFSGPTQVSLFDVSDFSQPQLLDEYTFQRFSTSEAEIDHHAFGWFATHGLLAIPASRGYIQRVDEDGDGYRESRQWVQEEQLAVLAVDVASGGKVSLVTEIGHDDKVRRSGYIGDKLYSVAADSVKVVDVGQPDTVIGEVILIEPASPPEDTTPNDTVVNYPANRSEGPLPAAVSSAQSHLAGQMEILPGASLFVAAETFNVVGSNDFHIVLRVGDNRYLYQTGVGDSVYLSDSSYDFPISADEDQVWHAILHGTPVGDLDKDGDVDEDDIDRLFANLGSTDLAYDLDSSGSVNAADVNELVLNILGTQFGDLDLDDDVDTRDLTMSLIHFTGAGNRGKGWRDGDTDGDGDVDTFDITTAVIRFTGAR